MAYAKHFDIINSPIFGTNLIEAGAGTGKTYTITCLFIRLLLEQKLDIDKILVVTFTQAATYELKDRIRARIYDAAKVFSFDILPCDIRVSLEKRDPFLLGLYKTQKNNQLAVRLLKNALKDFDKVAIYTIHGFCQRILAENTFESQLLFDTQLVVEIEGFMREIIEDFWRKSIYKQSALFINYLQKTTTINSLYNLVENTSVNQFIKIIPDSICEITDEFEVEQDYKKAFAKLSIEWKKVRNRIEEILETNKGLNRNKYRKGSIPILLEAMDDFIASNNNPFLFKDFVKFTANQIKASTKSSYISPSDPFFNVCEQLYKSHEKLIKLFEKKILKLKLELFSYLKIEQIKRKESLNICSFDDIIMNLYNALHSPSGKILAKKIKDRFPAVLIDEFQDTDPVQYDIFLTIFSKNGNKNILFLIGDPKQAIYGFRGADIFAYIDAAQKVENRYSLKENWRSEPALIKAVNTIFKNTYPPFVYKEIPFVVSSYPLHKTEQKYFTIDGEKKGGIKICFTVPDTKEKLTINKGDAKELICRYFAGEISSLLYYGKNKRALIGAISLLERDIAVLVRTNAEARMMHEALLELNIKNVLYNTGNVFETDEANEMARLLFGIVNYENFGAVKSAISTKMFGLSAEELYLISENEKKWENWIAKFKEYNNLWRKYGFIRMFNYILKKENFLAILIAASDGERKTTNILHLSEILHKVSIGKKLGTLGLVKWLSARIFSTTKSENVFVVEESLLRLESDKDAVKIVTIHKSKGLEYPIVFCPFMFDEAKLKRYDNTLKFHDEKNNNAPVLDIGSQAFESNRIYEQKEILAENIRLLYVAITRAKHLCYLAWGLINKSQSSSLAYLFHNSGQISMTNPVYELKKHVSKKSGIVLKKELIKLAKKSNKSIEVVSINNNYKEKFFRQKKKWGISSFSSIVPSMHSYNSTELADRNILLKSYNILGISKNSDDIYAFPKGIMAGTFMHDFIQHIDFTSQDLFALESLVLNKLAQYGYDSSWKNIIINMIKQLLNVQIDKEKKLYLSKIKNKNRINEFKFYFPLRSVSVARLAYLFSKKFGNFFSGYDKKIKEMNIKIIKGFMKGFIDVVFMYKDRFYIIDWKSNYLGDNIENYAHKSLKKIMIEYNYILQYYIYTIALNQYLNTRISDYDYNKHFGKVFYIFLRGVDSTKGADFGIFVDRPDKVLIDEISNIMMDITRI